MKLETCFYMLDSKDNWKAGILINNSYIMVESEKVDEDPKLVVPYDIKIIPKFSIELKAIINELKRNLDDTNLTYEALTTIADKMDEQAETLVTNPVSLRRISNSIKGLAVSLRGVAKEVPR